MNLRMHVIWAVFKRNFLSYFSGPLGYVFIVVFVAIGSLVAFRADFFSNNLANLNQLNEWFPVLLLFFVPAITMSAWADERKNGTDELLFTLPAADFEIVLGKYLALLGIYTVALLFSLSHVVVLHFLGGFDFGLMLSTYIGYWVMGAALIACGMVASVLTNSATVAYILGAILCAVPVFIDRIAPTSRLLQGLSVQEQARDFGLGMVPLGGLLYFASLTAFMLYLNLVFVSRRHWLGGPHGTSMGSHYLVRAIALGLALIGINVVASRVTRRVDLTTEKLYSVSPATRKVIDAIPADHPILIQAFLSPSVPHELAEARTSVVGLLRQFDQIGGDKVRVRIASTQKYTEAADEAKRYGIEPQEVQTQIGGKWTRDDVFMGLVVTGSVDDQVIIPFIDKGTPVEYELTRSVRTVAQGSRKKLGVLKTDAQITGGFDMQSFRSLPEWRIVADLKKQYDVKPVTPDELATSKDLDVLLAVMPSSLTDPEMESLVTYIQQGNPTLIVDDPFPRFHPNLAPRNPKPKPGGGGPFGGGPPPQPKADNGDATKLSTALEIAWNSGESVWDRYVAHPELKDLFDAWQLYNVVDITPANEARDAFSKSSPVTRGLQEVLLFYPGVIKPREGMKLTFEPLLRAGVGCRTYEWNEYVRGGFMGMMEIINPPDKDPADDIKAPVIAAHITGGAKGGDSGGKGSGINVVFVADMDMISNEFFFIRDKEWQDLKLDNISFILNAVDQLAGDNDFIDLRGRRPLHRTLTTVESRVKTFKEREAQESQSAEKAAKSELDQVNKDLQKVANDIRERTDLDPRTKNTMIRIAEENAQRELDVKKAVIENEKNKKIKSLKDQTERDVNGITGAFRLLAVILPPIPALLLGLFVYIRRHLDERKGMNPDRMVGSR